MSHQQPNHGEQLDPAGDTGRAMTPRPLTAIATEIEREQMREILERLDEEGLTR